MIDLMRQPLLLCGVGLLAGLVLLSYGSCVLVDGISAQRGYARNSRQVAVPTVPNAGIRNGNEEARVKFLFEDRWYLETVDKSEKVPLPEFLPGPEQFKPPARAIPVEDLARVLRETIDVERRFSGEPELALLAEVRVAGAYPFRGLVPAQKTEKKAAVDSGRNPAIADSPPAAIPPEIDPDSALFREAMADWRDQVVSQLQGLSASASPFRITFFHPTESRQVSLSVYEEARQRVLSAQFGNQNRDIMIFLQVLANMYGERQSVDGRFGPRTEQGLRHLIGNAFGKPQAADTYIAKAKKYR